ncbi:hypothetical protein QQ045_009681 [Rhodiola kirilowii]
MQYLSIAINALSGQLPKELGLLTDLRSLAISTNNFSGSLPSELGNLAKLDQLLFRQCWSKWTNSANIHGWDFSWASDNELNGSIPEFIGIWTKLRILRLQGNNFHGSIPLKLDRHGRLVSVYGLALDCYIT